MPKKKTRTERPAGSPPGQQLAPRLADAPRSEPPPGRALRPPLPKRKKKPRPIGPRGLDLLHIHDDQRVDPAELIPVAKLGKVWGVHGDITVRPYNADTDYSGAADLLWLKGEAVPLACVGVKRWTDKGSKVVVQFDGIRSPQDARALTHLEILLPKGDLPEPDEAEIYVHELLGMLVVDEIRGELGRIAEVFTTPANDVWVVRGDEEHLIPAVPSIVLDVDSDARVVRVHYEYL